MSETLGLLSMLDMIAHRAAGFHSTNEHSSLVTDNGRLSLSEASCSAGSWKKMGQFLIYLPQAGRVGVYVRVKNQSGVTSNIKVRAAFDGNNTDSDTKSYTSGSVQNLGVTIGSTIATKGFHTVEIWLNSSSTATCQILQLSWGFSESAN